jgi:hypothetical protein
MTQALAQAREQGQHAMNRLSAAAVSAAAAAAEVAGADNSSSAARAPRVLTDSAKRRRLRVATVVVLRSFVAPLLLHSVGHSLPSWFSHEIIVDVEDLVDGVP